MSENKKTKRIAILTSGGDSPGMNNVISAVYKTIEGINCQKLKKTNFNAEDDRLLELFLIQDGYQGIIEKKIFPVDEHWKKLMNIGNRIGGTIIGSGRYPDFKYEDKRIKAKKNLDELNIEALIAIGGNGTFVGLQRLSELGVKCFGIPGTIDNDIDSSDVSIGFDTALNTIVDAIDRIRETSDSHGRISIIEVMGRHCGKLATRAAVSCDFFVSPEHEKISDNELIGIIEELKTKKKLRSIVVLVTEHLYDVKKLAAETEQKLNVETRATVLGQIQRGGSPSAFDRYLGSMMAVTAVEAIDQNKSSSVVCLKGNSLVLTALPIPTIPSISKDSFLSTIPKIWRLSGVFRKK